MIKIDGIESIANMMEDKKGGRKRSKKGGTPVQCPVCKTMYDPNEGECPVCYLRKVNAQEKTNQRRDKKTKNTRRDTRVARRSRTKSPFHSLRIKKPENRKLTAHEEALNNANDQYEQQWQRGELTPRAIVGGVIQLGGLYNQMVAQARELLTTKKKKQKGKKKKKRIMHQN